MVKATFCEGVVSMNANNWALQNLKEWMEVHANTDDPIPVDHICYTRLQPVYEVIKHERNELIKND